MYSRKKFSNVQLIDPRKELRRSIEVELMLKRLKHKKIVLRTPAEVEDIFNKSLHTGLIRTVTQLIAADDSEIHLIHLYDSIVSDYFVLSLGEIEARQTAANQGTSYQMKYPIAPSTIHTQEAFLKYSYPHYLGYDLRVVLHGSGHERLIAFTQMEEAIEKIKKQFGIA